jgi:tetratricopeptide (TPR) repeat protein
VISLSPDQPRYIRPNDWSAFAAGIQAAGGPESKYSTVIRQGLREHPEAPILVFPECNRLFELGRHQETIPLLEAYLRLQPTDLVGGRYMAMALIFAGRPEEARKLLEEILRIDPNDAAAKSILQNLSSIQIPQPAQP